MSDGPVTPRGSGVRIALKVIPRSPRAGIAGTREGRLLVRVTAPPVDSAANDAVVELLAEVLGVPRRAVTLVAGATSRHKVVDVDGVDPTHVRARLAG